MLWSEKLGARAPETRSLEDKVRQKWKHAWVTCSTKKLGSSLCLYESFDFILATCFWFFTYKLAANQFQHIHSIC